MPHSLRVRLKKIYEKGLDHYLLTDKDVERLIHALDVVDAIEDIKTEIEQNSLGGIGGDRFIFTDNVIRIIDKHIEERSDKE